MEPQNQIFPEPNDPREKLGTPLTIVSFCIPLIGIILYFVYRRDQPQKAQTACYAALAGMVLGIIIRVLTMGMRGYVFYP